LPDAALDYFRRPDWQRVEQDLAWLERPGNGLLPLDDPRYPPLLRQIPYPPPLLFVHGDPDCLRLPQLAIVGARNPTPLGRETAQRFAAHLAECGLLITSGLALGIDAAAHEGALAGGGRTIAVMGTSLDRVYPARNRDLAHAIAERGALVSELAIGTPPTAENFPRRNRLISGLALGVLVVEAAAQSGSLITARLATEQGREVFAVPGSIHNPLAKGCHALIRQGAKLVETAADILEELGALAAATGEVAASRTSAPTPVVLDEEYRHLLAAMGDEPVGIDLLVDRCGLTAEALSSMLLILELEGYVAAMPGGLYGRLKT
jgi:DNA processing protein